MTKQDKTGLWRGMHPWEWAAVLFITLVMALQTLVFLNNTALRFFAPHDNNYPESMQVWQTMQLAETGRWPYGHIAEPPHDLGVYGPFFYGPPAIAACLFDLGRWGVFLVGRAYSLLAAAGFLALGGYWLRRRGAGWTGIAAMLLVFGASRPAMVFSSGFRPDHVAAVLSFGGLALMRKSAPWRFLGILAMSAALYTKMNFLAAPLALGLVWSLERRWRDLLVWGGAGIAMCAAFLLLFSLLSGGAFWSSDVAGPGLHGFSWVQWMEILYRDLPILILPLSLALCAGLCSLHRDRRDLLAWYFIVSLLVQLCAMAKIGANINYLAEPLSIGAVLFGRFAWQLLCRQIAPNAAWRRACLAMAFAPTLLVVIGLSLPVAYKGFAALRAIAPEQMRFEEEAQQALARQLPVAPEDRVLSNEAGLWPRLGRPAIVDLYHYRLMVERGYISTRPIREMLESKQIRFVIVKQPDGRAFDPQWLRSEFTSSVARSIQKHYRVVGRSGPYLVATPDTSNNMNKE